jgi:hypothetical protein
MTIKDVDLIEYRRMRSEPTMTGWYYGRPLFAMGGQPVPVAVTFVDRAEGIAILSGAARGFRLDDFEWFGPVAKCRIG